MPENSGQKTEKPTSKKLRDARKKGQVAKSKDITSTLLFAGIVGLILTTRGPWMEQLTGLLDLPHSFMGQTDSASAMKMLSLTIAKVALITLPILLLSVTLGIVGSLMQFGFLLSGESLKPKLDKVNPAQGLKKIFSSENLFEAFKSLVKIIGLFYICYIIFRGSMSAFCHMPYYSLSANVELALAIFTRLFLWVLALMVVLSGADFIFQKHSWIKKLMMSKDEVKREFKEMEGDPLIKSKRNQMRQEISMNNMLQSARKATVLVTNPTHLAVALFYDQSKTDLPQVLGKGRGHLAAQLVKVAEEEGIPIMQNVSLAHALYGQAEVEQFIPSALIKPVAEVLRYITYIKKEGMYISEQEYQSYMEGSR